MTNPDVATPTDEPIKAASGYLLMGGVKNRAGTLILFPDRLVHVGMNPLTAVMYTGLLGYLLREKVGKGRAIKRAAAGGKLVTEINLFRVTRVEKGTQGLNKNILVVEGDTGRFRFGVKYDQWSEHIARAIFQLGRKVTGNADGFDAA